MSDLTRRQLLAGAATAAIVRAAAPAFRIGVTDGNLRLGAKPEAVALAKKLGFDGVQVYFGRKLIEDKLPLDNPDLIAQYRKLSADQKVPLCGTCVDRLHENGLKSDP